MLVVTTVYTSQNMVAMEQEGREEQGVVEEVVVVGGGIIGLTTAYQLSSHYRVTVVEGREGVSRVWLG